MRTKLSLSIITTLTLLLSIMDVAPVHAVTITVTNTNDGGAGSLRQTIANAAADDTIIFDAGLSGQTIFLASTLTLTKDITIDGSALASPITISGDTNNDGTGDVQILIVNSAVTATLKRLIIKKGSTPSNGGGIYSSGILTIMSSTIRDNVAYIGGGIYQNGGTLTIADSTISGNPAYYRGGGIHNDHGKLTITNSLISYNAVHHYGAGINNDGGVVKIINSTISDNTANNLSDASNHGLSIQTGTEAPGRGGAIHHYGGGTLTITNSVISNNYAGYDGGAIAYRPSTTGETGSLAIINSTISNNYADSNAGGLSMDGDTLTTITNSTFSDNTAGYSAGAIYDSLGTLTITNSTFNGNSATFITTGIYGGNGGAIYFSSGSLEVTNSIFNDNAAGNSGGGIYNTYTTLNITNSTFSKNSAVTAGGDIYHDNGTVKITNSTLAGSSAVTGGGILVNAGTLDYANTIIANSVNGGDCINNGSMGININNLVEDGSCSAVLSGNPNLGLLANNGGFTQTIALLSGSMALDAGNSVSCPATDQRNITRPQGLHCDIGAYEYIPLATPTQTPTPTIVKTPTKTSTRTSTRTPIKTATPIKVKVILNSIGAQDGWVRESGENSNIGGTTNSTDTAFRLGDAAANRQYRAVLSFNTGSSIPDNATVIGVILKVKQQGIVGTGNPVSIFQGFLIDLKNGFIANIDTLQIYDFQAVTSITLGPASPAPVGGVYSFNLTNGKAFINKLATNGGLTQIRLRFKLDDNNDALANVINLYSGNAVNAADRPQLVITYMVP